MDRGIAEGWKNGTTVVVTIVDRENKKIFVSDVGDSEAVLARKEGDKYTAECISFKHKPNDDEEKSRIEKHGGQVIFGRILGSLAVAR